MIGFWDGFWFELGRVAAIWGVLAVIGLLLYWLWSRD